MQKKRLSAGEFTDQGNYNHLWWCCASSIGYEELIREKWLSMLNDIQGIHSWEDKSSHKCEHRQLDQERKWLKTNSPSFLALKNVVEFL